MSAPAPQQLRLGSNPDVLLSPAAEGNDSVIDLLSQEQTVTIASPPMDVLLRGTEDGSQLSHNAVSFSYAIKVLIL